MFTYRAVKPEDLESICRFPSSEKELFYMFPGGRYPLTKEQLQEAVDKRFESTVILSAESIAGFANYYLLKPGEVCHIGNVIVNPALRNQGAGAYLVRTMVAIAREKYQIPRVCLVCHNNNLPALLLYTKLGFKPVSISKTEDKRGKPLAAITLEYAEP
ncbi:N-acetyltransferase [Paenibacillus sp. J2TS4]|uniref:GNAT family N-acetyltransferase n=1 Tax=Paenibacillus sp. J2TS4 TaxID=2807194 RepID=UPI001B2A41B2|nr:N-acetyltransferase [Paenibacillus sp. J2TS4]GIP36168.1 N-acetyltransferase [Paenibacillus sp. J2TS4]